MDHTAVQAGAYLHHVAFESANPARLAGFYGAAMDMEVAQVSDREWRCEGPGRRMILQLGVDKRLAYGGFACRNAGGLAAIRLRAKQENMEILPSPSAYFKLGDFAVRDPNGQLICFGLTQSENPPI